MVAVTIPEDLSYNGKQRKKRVGIDRCIADIVAALEAGNIMMRHSCCGHGRGEGDILLQDGRVLLIRFPKKKGK